MPPLRLSAWAMNNDELAHAASYTADFGSGSAASAPWYANNSDNAVALAPAAEHCAHRRDAGRALGNYGLEHHGWPP
jgi:hypothetical protein